MSEQPQTLHKRFIPYVVSLGMFMEAVDTTIINTAIPAMSRSLNVNPIDLKIALISYLVSLAIFIPISGWIADKFGIKRVFITALLIFIFASFWCGYSHTLLELVIARTIQGFGGSLMVPVGRLIIARTFQRHELVTAMSQVVMVAALGMMLGPVLGGYITHYISWPWIFWVNIPIGLLTIFMAKRLLEDTKPQIVPPLDKFGFLLFGIGLAALTLGLSTLSESASNSSLNLFVIFSAIVLLIIYFFHSRKQINPVVNSKLFLFRTFQVSAIGNLIARTSFGGMPFLLPLLLQIGLDYPAQISGLLLAPTALGVLLIKPFSPWILRHLGYKRLLIFNTVLVGLMLWSFMLINSHTSIYAIAFLTFIFGFLMALQYTGMNSLAYAEIPPENLSACTSIMSTIQQLSQSFGVAIAALLINYYSRPYDHNTYLTPGVFHHAFLAMGFITLFSILIFTRLGPTDGQQMIEPQLSH